MAVPKDRKTYIDLVKILAIYMVVFNHTKTNGFVLFTVRQDSHFFWLYLFNAIVIKMGVPLFFMASGALLIEKEESIKQLINKRFLKYLTVLFVCSALQYLYQCLISDHQSPSLSYFLTTLYTSQITVPYWFLYAYLAYILMLPFIRRLAKAMTTKEYAWMVLMFGIISSLSIIDYLLWKGEAYHNGNVSFFITTSYLFYPLMGYFIDRRMSDESFNRKNLLILAVVSILSIVICSIMTVYRCEITGEWAENTCQYFFKTLIFIPAITVFYGAKMLFKRHKPSEMISKILSFGGSVSFGIYLCENIMRDITFPVFICLKPYIKTLPACWAWIFVACSLGAFAVALLKKIPAVSKYI